MSVVIIIPAMFFEKFLDDLEELKVNLDASEDEFILVDLQVLVIHHRPEHPDQIL